MSLESNQAIGYIVMEYIGVYPTSVGYIAPFKLPLGT